MEVQSVLADKTGRGARSRSIVAASVPVVMLAIVIGVGSLGRAESRSDDAPAPTAVETSRRVSILDPSRPAPLGISVNSVDALARSDDSRFPRRALGVPAWSVGDAVELFLAGALTDRLVGIGGWLSFPLGRPTCMHGTDATDPVGDLCPRRAILTDGASPARLPLQFPPGVSLDGVLGPGASWTDASFPIPVVVLGGFDDPRAVQCAAGSTPCHERFVVEQMTWADGRWLGRPAVLGGDVAGATTSEPLGSYVAQYSLGNVPTILSAALVSRDLLVTIDAAADAETPRDATGPLWYMRIMPERLGVDVRGRDVRWIVIDAETSSVVARHPAAPVP